MARLVVPLIYLMRSPYTKYSAISNEIRVWKYRSAYSSMEWLIFTLSQDFLGIQGEETVVEVISTKFLHNSLTIFCYFRFVYRSEWKSFQMWFCFQIRGLVLQLPAISHVWCLLEALLCVMVQIYNTTATAGKEKESFSPFPFLCSTHCLC